MKNKLQILLLFLLIANSEIVISQKVNIDSLKKELITAKEDTNKVILLNTLCKNIRQSDYREAFGYSQSAYDLAKKIKYKRGECRALNNMAVCYWEKSQFDKAMDMLIKATKAFEELNDKQGISACYNNLGIINKKQKNYSDAIKYYKKSLDIKLQITDKFDIGITTQNIGAVFFETKQYDSAMVYFQRAYSIFKEKKDPYWMGLTLENIGTVLNHKKNYKQSQEAHLEALEYKRKINDLDGLASSYCSIGNNYCDLLKYDKAIAYYDSALQISAKNNFKDSEWSAYAGLSFVYSKTGNYKKAYEYHRLASDCKDTLLNESSAKIVKEMEAKYESEKKDLELLQKDAEILKQQADSQRKLYQRNALLAGFIFVFILSVFAFYSLRKIRKQNLIIQQKNKVLAIQNEEILQQKEEILSQRDNLEQINVELLQKNEEIIAQRDEIEAQRDEISAQRDTVTKQKEQIEVIHKELTDSIRYAERIQKVLLPSDELINKLISFDISSNTKLVAFDNVQCSFEYFVMFKPRDIVSGDFYYFCRKNNTLLIAVADCTGHGVPGAFMSMLGISFLNEILAKYENHTAGQVLDELRQLVISSLQQKGVSGEQKDGMDIVFITIDLVTLQLQYAGANNPLWICSNNEDSYNLTEVKPDKMPVAIFEQMSPFTNNVLQLKPSDAIYLATDGYEDQFGGPKGKKFMSKKLKQMIELNCFRSMTEQRVIFESAIEEWKAYDGNIYEQIDDITLMGIKI